MKSSALSGGSGESTVAIGPGAMVNGMSWEVWPEMRMGVIRLKCGVREGNPVARKGRRSSNESCRDSEAERSPLFVSFPQVSTLDLTLRDCCVQKDEVIATDPIVPGRKPKLKPRIAATIVLACQGYLPAALAAARLLYYRQDLWKFIQEPNVIRIIRWPVGHFIK